MSASEKAKRTSSAKIKGIGIRGQLVLGFTAFAFVILLIVWIFQILLLDKFYEFTKYSELRSVLDTIEYSIDSEDIDEICSDLAAQYDVCIAIYTVADGCLNECIADKEVSPTCVIHYAEKESLNDYYAKALKSGSTYTQRLNLNPEPGFDNDEHSKEVPPHHREENRPKNREDLLSEVVVSVKALNDANGNEYAAFINLRFTPVNAIQQTRDMQFGYIALGVIIVAVFFALLFSIRIARPIERMTYSAAKMANGDYSVEFKAEGMRETKHLARTLNFAVEQISKTDNLQRELIANISHDLRTPLTLISGYSEMMRDIPGENTPENSQLIIDETKRLTTLVNDMLDYSKYSSGCNSPAFEEFNLTESVRKTMARYNEFVKVNGYTIDFDYDREACIVADERMILQVLYNLLNNAVNYTGEDKRVRITQRIIDDAKVRISIYDSGEGIPSEKLTDIWDRYYKVDKSHKRALTGSGLGLSIVSRLLQMHSASYGVESSEGKGSCFWFELPIA